MTTVKELACFLVDKQEHYPLSDAFIERYQQSGGGYIDFARKTGHLVDRQKCEPNQKWHFFESWLIRSFQDGTITCWDDDAKKVVWNKLQCPELLLWIMEAVSVDPVKVEAAKKIAEDGKEGNIRSDKEIRILIPWEVIEDAMKS